MYKKAWPSFSSKVQKNCHRWKHQFSIFGLTKPPLKKYESTIYLPIKLEETRCSYLPEAGSVAPP